MRALAIPSRAALALALACSLAAIGCYAPNYESKPCKDKAGCPEGYYCVSGLCSATPQSGNGDGGTNPGTPQPAEIRVDVSQMPSFTIGSPVPQDTMFATNDTPDHIRTLSRSFYLDEKEVTVALYQRCVDAGACQAARADHLSCNYGKPDRAEHPINCVDYKRATDFCTWIGRRLPTETEWEYAAKGPNASVIYPFGATFNAGKACYNVGSTCPVGSRQVKTFQGAEVLASASGFYDLAGNVYEWTRSEFCPYATYMDEGQGCTGIPVKNSVRGGSGFDDNPRSQTVSVRFGNLTTEVFDYRNGAMTGGHYNLGFRCARDG
jgi:formylglycine-generating enzyme required for sulfatase activity